MRQFFKIVFATLLALILFSVIGIFLVIGIISSAASSEKPSVGSKAVLVLNLSKPFKEQQIDNPIAELLDDAQDELPSLYETILLIDHAKQDSAVKGIYIQCADNANGFASSEELRKSILDFKKSGKFVIAHGEVISQKGYYIGSAADQIYCNPQGGLEWAGYSSTLFFLKGMLDKLEIQPQIFYAGKFKSATEPLRETKMTDANKLQTGVWLGELYTQFLRATATARKKDTTELRNLAVTGAIQTAYDAKKHGLVDGLKYDDEIKLILLKKLKQGERESINFVSLGDYKASVDYKKTSGSRIAIVFASGDIVSGDGDNEQVGSDNFKNVLRKVRLDKDIKAVVFRVNSPGGSALASEVIWREIALLKKEKPVVVSMGDVAASGGYYIACNADSVFANEGTITGSIGVFSIVPNMQSFFKNKLGITFDGVKTAPFADMGGIDKPLSDQEKRFMQASVDSIYYTFKTRVSDGRLLSMDYVDSLAQGRVWTGTYAKSNGLVDHIGGIQNAIDCAARMAKINNKEYKIREYPEKKSFLEQLMNGYKKSISEKLIANQIGVEEAVLLKELKQIKTMQGVPQAKMPFLVTVH
ncbi:MAG: signal peptide peptidase SppA [Sediminibacterium sp.]|nr:MAG: protease [Chitinophagaceae bacterium]MDP1844190.1 signal peptide peptidase SppA [Sediminibacterium sp.]TXT32324.1 MAG: protease IV [Chitinophagaceae bacterium]